MLLDVDYVPARKALIESQTSSPFELDLGWTVDLKKEHFVGRHALARGGEPRSAVAVRRPGGRLGLARARSTPRSGLRRSCRRPRGARACRSTPAASRSATRPAAAGRRCSRSTSRSRICESRVGGAGHRARDRGHRRAPAQARRGARGEEAVLRSGAQAGMTAQRYDAIVIGGGHNGLVCAAYLARAGKRCWCSSAASASAARR